LISLIALSVLSTAILPMGSPAASPSNEVLVPYDLPAAVRMGPSNYPRDALAQREQGVVRVLAVLGDDGNVKDALISDSSGFADLDLASLAFVKGKARFASAQLEGKPIKSIIVIAVSWSLPGTAEATMPDQSGAASFARKEYDHLTKRGAIMFAHDAAGPGLPQLPGIKLLADDLKSNIAHGTAVVILRGYASGPGDQSRRARQLSQKRALAIYDLLVSDGVPQDRIQLRAMGGADDHEGPDRVDIYLGAK
jgi:TonB family protein